MCFVFAQFNIGFNVGTSQMQANPHFKKKSISNIKIQSILKQTGINIPFYPLDCIRGQSVKTTLPLIKLCIVCQIRIIFFMLYQRYEIRISIGWKKMDEVGTSLPIIVK